MSAELSDIIFWGENRPRAKFVSVTCTLGTRSTRSMPQSRTQMWPGICRPLATSILANKTGQSLCFGLIVNWHGIPVAEVSTL